MLRDRPTFPGWRATFGRMDDAELFPDTDPFPSHPQLTGRRKTFTVLGATGVIGITTVTVLGALALFGKR